MIVLLEKKLYIYNMNDLEFIEGLDTFNNPFGLCSLNTDNIASVIAFPGEKLGTVSIYHFGMVKFN